MNCINRRNVIENIVMEIKICYNQTYVVMKVEDVYNEFSKVR